jgi:hypothetical protein
MKKIIFAFLIHTPLLTTHAELTEAATQLTSSENTQPMNNPNQLTHPIVKALLRLGKTAMLKNGKHCSALMPSFLTTAIRVTSMSFPRKLLAKKNLPSLIVLKTTVHSFMVAFTHHNGAISNLFKFTMAANEPSCVWTSVKPIESTSDPIHIFYEPIVRYNKTILFLF